jgi:succinate dehydrogenase hydrophobic anchor subunit
METTKPKTLPLSKRGFSFEVIMWIFTRLSALAMYALILVGLISALVISAQLHTNLATILRWAFLPQVAANPLSALPWLTVLARLMVTAFLLVLSAHGVHGILVILDDYFTSPLARRWFRNLIIAFFVVANAIAIYVIWISR